VVKIKFCGMTNPIDCQKAVGLGVDFVGFVFYGKSARYVKPEDVRSMVQGIEGRAQTVGVFVDEDDAEIEEIMAYTGLDFCQIHRDTRLKNRIRTFRIKDKAPEVEPDAEGLVLFDTYSEGFGGSGKAFDLGLLRGSPLLSRAFIAGGIGEENVKAALSLRPFGVDLVSSIEITKGRKDHRKMESFVRKVRQFG
jgi:phosphoribosylanthranilate isomerase